MQKKTKNNKKKTHTHKNNFLSPPQKKSDQNIVYSDWKDISR